MSLADFVEFPVLLRALVVGAFGGVGLALTTYFSRRGPLIFPVYAAPLAALAVLLARYPALGYAPRYAAALGGFTVAARAHYAVVCAHANAQRRRLGVTSGVPLLGHAWRLAALLGTGAVLCAGVAFVAA